MNTAQKLRVRGFTLIELLVVIAVLGILAAVVLVAINPSERINEANDAGTKNNVSQVASAVESCYTATAGDHNGTYDACNSLSELADGSWLKQTSGLVDSNGDAIQIAPSTADPEQLVVYGVIKAASATCEADPDGTAAGTGTKYYTYWTQYGQTTVHCGAAPTP